jgi:hypothetical protein
VKHDKSRSDFFFMAPSNVVLQTAGECRPLAHLIKATFKDRRIEREFPLRRMTVLLAIAAEGDNRH